MQKKLIPSFTTAEPRRRPFSGSAETIGTFTHLFAPGLKKRGSTGGSPPSSGKRRSNSLPRSSLSPGCRGRAAPGAVGPAQPPIAADQLLLQRFSRRRADERQGRYPLHQRAHGKLPGARRARPTGTSSPWRARGCATSSAPVFQRPCGKKASAGLKGVKVGTNGGSRPWTSHPPDRRAGGPAGDGDDRFYGGGHAAQHPGRGQALPGLPPAGRAGGVRA